MQVKLNTLPATLAEFQALPRSTPEEVCAGFLCALNLYTKAQTTAWPRWICCVVPVP